MKLAVETFSIFVDKLESVRAVAVHMAIAIGNSPVTEQEGHLVSSLRPKRDKVPEHV